jgi:hypothetical protein
MSDQRYREAAELADAAEALVRDCEANLEAATDPTVRDVLETELRSALEMQDEVLDPVAPAIAERERRVRAGVHAAIAALRGDFMHDWTMRHRRWHSIAVKSRLVGMVGWKRYEAWWPW